MGPDGGLESAQMSEQEQLSSAPAVPESVPEPFRTALVVATDAWMAEQGERLISLVLFGSVARSFCAAWLAGSGTSKGTTAELS